RWWSASTPTWRSRWSARTPAAPRAWTCTATSVSRPTRRWPSASTRPGSSTASSARWRTCAPGRSAELLGEPDEDPLGAADVAEPVRVAVAHHVADQLRAVAAQPGEDVVDVVDGEHDPADAERVHRGVGRRGAHGRGLAERRQLDPAVPVRGAQHRDLLADAVDPDDAIRPLALDRRPALELHAELDEERDGRVEVLDDDEDVVHAGDRHSGPPWLVRPLRPHPAL